MASLTPEAVREEDLGLVDTWRQRHEMLTTKRASHLDIIALETLTRLMLVLTVGEELGQLQRHGAAATSWRRDRGWADWV